MEVDEQDENRPLEEAAVRAIRVGDIEALTSILAENPILANARIDGCRTLLHVATDWPGHFPNSGASISALIESGADVNAGFIGRHSETPLHWAASSNDVCALDALLDHGADIEAAGSVIGGGTALSDAVAFGQWQAARRLVERGAQTNLWQAAALGLLPRLADYFAGHSEPAGDEITNAFWSACHGGQRSTAEYLISRGADMNWVGYDGLTALDAANRTGAGDIAQWLQGLGAKSARTGCEDFSARP